MEENLEFTTRLLKDEEVAQFEQLGKNKYFKPRNYPFLAENEESD